MYDAKSNGLKLTGAGSAAAHGIWLAHVQQWTSRTVRAGQATSSDVADSSILQQQVQSTVRRFVRGILNNLADCVDRLGALSRLMMPMTCDRNWKSHCMACTAAHIDNDANSRMVCAQGLFTHLGHCQQPERWYPSY
jgi:hypothetical protein